MKIRQLLMIAFSSLIVCSVCSCKEDDNEVDEFPNWKDTNEAYFSNLYTTTKNAIAKGDTQWKVLPGWSFLPESATIAERNIVAKIVRTGTGTETPLYTDSVHVHYDLRLLPSTSYPQGKLIDRSYTGTLDPETCLPTKFAVSGVVDGFSTALMNMHVGDWWVIYVPYQLGYGKGNSDIPAYSTLVFNICLAGIYHPGKKVPAYK
ncbi:MAG: FKBP-type peptidyl-prolyl cis-trans isomerase [Prevotella sp.]|nr:FKBP-type peptidyl-prolyl cis-trans isomerase [Prevotella sp.]